MLYLYNDLSIKTIFKEALQDIRTTRGIIPKTENGGNIMIKAVIFDMDGLMFDTERIASEGWKEAGKQLGFSIDEQQFRQMRGRTAAAGRQLFREWYGEGISYDEGRKIRTAYLEQYVREHGTPIKDGLVELFQYLKEHAIPKAIATSSPREMAVLYFERAGLEFDFDQSVCGAEITNGKPAPDVFLKAAGKLGFSPEECLVLEDSFSGVRAGYAAGCHVIMIPDLQEPDEETRKMCDAVYGTLKDVIAYLSPDIRK